MGQETYQVQLTVNLHPVTNQLGQLVDVDVRFTSELTMVWVPHEVVWDKIYEFSSGTRLFGDEEGSFTLDLHIKLENFSRVVFDKSDCINVPTNHTFIIYCFLDDAETHGILQLTVQGEKHLVLNTLRNPVTTQVSYIEKFEV